MIYCFSCCGSLRLGVLEGSEGGKKKRLHSLLAWNITPYMFDLQFVFSCIDFLHISNLHMQNSQCSPTTAWWEIWQDLSAYRVSEVNLRKSLQSFFSWRPQSTHLQGKAAHCRVMKHFHGWIFWIPSTRMRVSVVFTDPKKASERNESNRDGCLIKTNFQKAHVGKWD